MNRTKLAVLCAAVFSIAAPALAQNEPPKVTDQFYRFDFVIKEIDSGKTVKTHNYQMMVSLNGGKSSIRSGTKVPVVTDNGKGSTTYIDVGVNLDVHHLLVTRDGLEFDIVAEATSTVDGGTATSLTKQPMINQTMWNSRVELAMGKPATIFSSDDPSSRHQLQLEVTATPIH
jgi:hypothetical protein